MKPPRTPFATLVCGVERDVNGNGALGLFLGDGATNDYPSANVMVPDSRWAHVAFVYDGTSVAAYLDGVGAGTTPMNVKITTRGTALRFGADGKGGQPFGGKLDEVRIYDRLLSAPEVARLAGL